jgi:cell division protein FtsL
MSALDRLIVGPLPRPFPQTASVRPVALGAFLVIAAVGMLQVLQTSNATTAGYSLSRLETNKMEVQAEVHQLEADVASLTSMERIEQEARGRLGMVPAESTLTLEVHKQPPEQQLVPRRFLSTEEEAPTTESQPWWRELLGFLPF